jgi:mannose-6-phosphate isomerase-like protein (cupin superfamily)
MSDANREPRPLHRGKWAGVSQDGHLEIDTAPGPVQMANSQGTATPILSMLGLGIDRIRFPAGGGVDTHIHDGNHILLAAAGDDGKVVYDGVDYPLEPGDCYFVEGKVPHAIQAGKTALVLFAIGDRHVPAGSPERMELVTDLRPQGAL